MATPLIEPVAKLIESFARLPGIGPKTAQRLTYHLLRAPDAEARTLAAALVAVRDQVVFCERCFNISDQPLCPICRDPARDVRRLCVVEEPLDRVVHTMGWPLRFAAKYREFGGSFIYPMGEDKVSMGFVTGLDYRDARFSVHDALQELKGHPLVAEIIEGGKRIGWGAKTLPSGGYWAPAVGAGHGDLRRRRGHGQRAHPEGRPLRHARGDVRRRGDRRAPQGGA